KESGWQNAKVDPGWAMEAGKAPGGYGTQPQNARGNGRKFTGAALAITTATDNSVIATRLGALGIIGIHHVKDEIGNGGNVGAKWQHLGAGSHNLIGGYIVPYF